MTAMKAPLALALAATAIFLFPDAAAAQANRPTKTIRGTIFNDPNGNGRLDPQEKGGVASTIWVYRIMPNGSRRLIRRVRTDAVGNYTLANLPHGRYFMGVRYGNRRFAVRTGIFTIGPRTGGAMRNIPVATAQTINRYPGLSRTPNPANLSSQAPVSPFRPRT